MDKGVIRSLKAKYRTKMVQKMIDAVDRKKLLPQISMLGAMKMLVLAWDEVSSKTVQNWFKSDDPFFALKDSIRELCRLVENLVPKDLITDDVAFLYDDLAATQPPLTDENILADLIQGDIEEDQIEKDEDSEFSEVIQKPSSSQIRGAIDCLMDFTMIIGSTELQTLTVKASKVVEVELTSNVTQKKITDIF